MQKINFGHKAEVKRNWKIPGGRTPKQTDVSKFKINRIKTKAQFTQVIMPKASNNYFGSTLPISEWVLETR